MKAKKDLTAEIIKLALLEDRVSNDITTSSLSKYDKRVIGDVVCKGDGIVSGTGVFIDTFNMVDPEIVVDVLRKDGSKVKKGDIILIVKGLESSILKAERTALNFLQRLCGVATITADYVKMLAGSHIRLLDTRKTTPGLRYLQKKAVVDGGGCNHRLNLADMVLVKDNHIKMAGTITNAVREAKQRYPQKKIEVEVKNLEELKEAQALQVDWIMLDNFDQNQILEAIAIKNAQCKFEVSGDINLDNIQRFVIKGIDYISVGAITHSYSSMDLSLNIRR